MINGGTYGNYTLAFQEFIVIPKNVSTFYEGPELGWRYSRRWEISLRNTTMENRP